MVIKNVKLTVDKMAKDVKESGLCDVFKWFMFMVSQRPGLVYVVVWLMACV